MYIYISEIPKNNAMQAFPQRGHNARFSGSAFITMCITLCVTLLLTKQTSRTKYSYLRFRHSDSSYYLNSYTTVNKTCCLLWNPSLSHAVSLISHWLELASVKSPFVHVRPSYESYPMSTACRKEAKSVTDLLLDLRFFNGFHRKRKVWRMWHRRQLRDRMESDNHFESLFTFYDTYLVKTDAQTLVLGWSRNNGWFFG